MLLILVNRVTLRGCQCLTPLPVSLPRVCALHATSRGSASYPLASYAQFRSVLRAPPADVWPLPFPSLLLLWPLARAHARPLPAGCPAPDPAQRAAVDWLRGKPVHARSRRVLRQRIQHAAESGLKLLHGSCSPLLGHGRVLCGGLDIGRDGFPEDVQPVQKIDAAGAAAGGSDRAQWGPVQRASQCGRRVLLQQGICKQEKLMVNCLQSTAESANVHVFACGSICWDAEQRAAAPPHNTDASCKHLERGWL